MTPGPAREDEVDGDRGSQDGLAPVASQLQAAVAEHVRAQHLPGVAAGVVVGDELAWSTGWGRADVATGRPPDVATLFMIGSLTKTFTGTAVMQLRDRGLLDLDEPVSRYLPELRERDVAGGLSAVTVRRPEFITSSCAGVCAATDEASSTSSALARKYLWNMRR